MPLTRTDENKRKLRVICNQAEKTEKLGMILLKTASDSGHPEIALELMDIVNMARTAQAKATHCINLIEGKAQ